MASASYTLKNIAQADVTFSLAGNTSRGAEYKLTSRDLATPLALNVQYNLGGSGARGNDHLIVTIADTVVDSDGVAAVGSVKMDVSVPRNAGWTGTKTQDLMSYLATLLSVGRIPSVAVAVVP